VTAADKIYLDPLPTPQRVLIVLAHPDDAEFFAGGTLAKWASEGAHLTLFLITSGDKGSGDVTMLDHQALATLREAETRAAASCLGIQEVTFLRWRDGELTPNLELRREITRMIRLKRPDALMSSDPLLRYRAHNRINHPDHWSVAEAVNAAFFPAARDHLSFPELHRDEGLEPHKTRWLYLSLPTNPNYRVEITDFRQRQIEALKLHRSQIGDPVDFETRMHDRYDPELTGDGEPRYVEYFHVIDLG
jgi:LmbE family N-acetylglucosaminyl deacetylase